MNYLSSLLGYDSYENEMRLYQELFKDATCITESKSLQSIEHLPSYEWNGDNSKMPTLSNKTMCFLHNENVVLALHFVLCYLFKCKRYNLETHGVTTCDNVLLKTKSAYVVVFNNVKTRSDPSGYTFIFDLSRINQMNYSKESAIIRYDRNKNDGWYMSSLFLMFAFFTATLGVTSYLKRKQ